MPSSSTLRVYVFGACLLCISVAGFNAGCGEINARLNAPVGTYGVVTVMDTRFEPVNANPVGPRLTLTAVQIYKGDIAALQAGRPTIIGELDVTHDAPKMNQAAPTIQAMTARGALDAAAKGATHIFVMESGFDVRELTGEVADAGDAGAASNFRPLPNGIRLIALRIPADKWSLLPVDKRPAPFDEGAKVDAGDAAAAR